MKFRNLPLYAAIAFVFGCGALSSKTSTAEPIQITVMTFNILQGGNAANEIGSDSPLFNKPRYDDIAAVIIQSEADIVGVQENYNPNELLPRLQMSDPRWNRRGNTFSKFPLEAVAPGNGDLTLARAKIGDGRSVVVHNVHWSPSPYGPSIVQERIKNGGDLSENAILAASDKGTQYQATLDKVKPFMDANEMVFVVGDFNEPSHLDWTQNYADNGADRWVNNASGTPLKLKVAWKGSSTLVGGGLTDAYRKIHPDEVAKPGDTWTPPYANGTPGRRTYNADPTAENPVPINATLDRIDRIYFAGGDLRVLSARVMGEAAGTSELVYDGPWPSDHRAVVATFAVPEPAAQGSTWLAALALLVYGALQHRRREYHFAGKLGK